MDGSSETGPIWIKKKYDYFSLPLYIRENSIIPIEEDSEKKLILCNASDAVLSDIAEIKNGKLTIYDKSYRTAITLKSE